MLQSMTGYGRCQVEQEDFSFACEIKTVNHRYAELSIRSPRFLNPVESKIRRLILDRIPRGHIDVFINASYTGSGAKSVRLDKALASAYHNSLQGLRELLDMSGDRREAELLFIAGQPDVLVTQEEELDLMPLWLLIEKAVTTALDHLEAMRQTEGETLSRDIKKRIDTIEADLETIEKRAPETLTLYRSRLTESVHQLLQEAGDGSLAPHCGNGNLCRQGQYYRGNCPAAQSSQPVPAASYGKQACRAANGLFGAGNEPGKQYHRFQSG